MKGRGLTGGGDEGEARTRWFADVMAGRGAERRNDPAVAVGDHTQALLVELETVFGAGAWVATVILAVAVIEAHLREQAIASGRVIDPYLNAEAVDRVAAACRRGPSVALVDRVQMTEAEPPDHPGFAQGRTL